MILFFSTLLVIFIFGLFQILNSVWREVTALKSPAQYISCAEVWVQFAVKHFPVSIPNFGQFEYPEI